MEIVTKFGIGQKVYVKDEQSIVKTESKICPACEGEGKVTFKDMSTWPCPKCNGTGKLTTIIHLYGVEQYQIDSINITKTTINCQGVMEERSKLEVHYVMKAKRENSDRKYGRGRVARNFTEEVIYATKKEAEEAVKLINDKIIAENAKYLKS